MLLYLNPISAEKQADMNSEEMKKGTEDWMAWFKKNGEAIVDAGNPLGMGVNVTKQGAFKEPTQVTGYSIIQADDIEQIKSMLVDNPQYVTEDASIEVFEIMPIISTNMQCLVRLVSTRLCLVLEVGYGRDGRIFSKYNMSIYDQNAVYTFVRNIPKRKVVTYGTIAKVLRLSSPRTVGKYLHSNTDSQNVPCHRVVFSDGKLSQSYAFGGYEMQKQKLIEEGVIFKKNRVNNKFFLNLK